MRGKKRHFVEGNDLILKGNHKNPWNFFFMTKILTKKKSYNLPSKFVWPENERKTLHETIWKNYEKGGLKNVDISINFKLYNARE